MRTLLNGVDDADFAVDPTEACAACGCSRCGLDQCLGPSAPPTRASAGLPLPPRTRYPLLSP